MAGILKKSGGGILAKPTTNELGEIEGLVNKASEAGYEKEANKIAVKSPKLSILQRIGKGLGAFNPAEALLVNRANTSSLDLKTRLLSAPQFLGTYAKNVAQGLGSAITGNDYEKDRRYFSDVAEELGVKNGIAKFGLGFAGDVLLDPSTYFGGAIVKGVLGTAKGASNIALKGVGKLAPETEAGLRLAGTGLQDALGRAFAYGYKSSEGAKEAVLTFLSKGQRAKLELAASNLDRLGAGVLTKSQREELALKMIAGKRAEFAARNATPQNFQALKEIPQELQQKVLSYQMAKEAVDADPLKRLLKYESKKYPGTLSEEFIKGKGDVIAQSVGIDVGQGGMSMNDLGDAYERYAKSRSNVNKLKSELLKEKSIFKDEKFIDELTSKVASENTKAMAGQFARETATSTDPLVQKTIEEQIARSKKFAEGITDNPYETYFPFIKKDKLQKFLNETHGIKVGSEGYTKQFKNLLTNENMELDPAKAFFTRESQIVSDKMTREFLSDFVKIHGKGLNEFKNVDEAIKAGYTLIKEKGNFGKELGYVNKYDGALIRDSLSPEFQTVNMLAKATGFDAVTSLFKRSVTGLFAPFHIRNFVSGNIQNFEVLGKDVFNPKNIAAGQKIAYLMAKGKEMPEGVIKLAGETKKFSEVMKPFVERFSGDTFYNNDFLEAVTKGTELKQVQGAFSKEALKTTVKTLGLGQEATPFKIGRAIGQFIEHQQKATAYITALGQGKAIPEALKLAEAAGFDYRAVTRFESQIMRRLIPFYSFTRKNLELQLKTLGENPQRINQIMRFFGNAAEGGGLTDEERQALPDYLKEQLVVSFGKNKLGQPIVAGGFGTPVEQPGQVFGTGITDTIRKVASSLNPIIKAPLEKAFGKDFFQNRPISDIVDAKQYQILPKFIKDFIGFREVEKDVYVNNKKTGDKKTTYVADPEKLHILRNLPTTRLFSYLYEIYRPEDETIAGAKALNLATGVKPKPIDLETVEYFRDRDKQRELEDLLIRAGILKEFRNVYQPSDTKKKGILK